MGRRKKSEDVVQGTRANWIEKLERRLVRIMQEEIDKGRGSDGNFKSAVWTDILDLFNKKLEPPVTFTQIKDKYETVSIRFIGSLIRLLTNSVKS